MSSRQAAQLTEVELAALAKELQDAVVTFEVGLPAGVGTIGAWPELTVRRDGLRKVRRLACQA